MRVAWHHAPKRLGAGDQPSKSPRCSTRRASFRAGSSSAASVSIRIFPSAVDRLTNKVSMYAPHGVKSEDHRQEIEASFHAIMAAVRDEDYSVTSEAQVGLPALPPGTKFPVGRQEVGTQNFHRNVMAAMAD